MELSIAWSKLNPRHKISVYLFIGQLEFIIMKAEKLNGGSKALKLTSLV